MNRDQNRRWFWVVVIAVCTGAGGVRLWQNHRRHVTFSEWSQQCAFLLRQRAWAYPRLLTKLEEAHHLRPDFANYQLTRADVERALNHGRPLDRASRPNWYAQGDHTLWKDDVTGISGVLTFRNNRLVDVGAAEYFPAPPAPPEPPLFDRFTEHVRRSIAGSSFLGWGTALWLILLVLYAFRHERRRLISDWMLALAVLCTTAWLVPPAYNLKPQRILSNHMLFWGVALLVISAGMLVVAHLKAAAPSWPACGLCGYDLTGNVSGVCPECGTAVTPEETT